MASRYSVLLELLVNSNSHLVFEFKLRIESTTVCFLFLCFRFDILLNCKLYMITNKLRLSIYTSMNLLSKTQNFKRLRLIILDTLSDVLYKCLCFSLIKIESVSISQTKPCLVAFLSPVVYTFLLNSFN